LSVTGVVLLIGIYKIELKEKPQGAGGQAPLELREMNLQNRIESDTDYKRIYEKLLVGNLQNRIERPPAGGCRAV
jgi:hypothetical protein